MSTQIAKRLGPKMRLGARAREAVVGYVLISPWIVGFLAFALGPMIASAVLSLTSYNVIMPPRWAGLQNYQEALFHDELFWLAAKRTLQYALMYAPIGLLGSLLAALALDQKLRATSVIRTLYYLPSLTPIVAYATLWQWLLDPKVGLVNHLLRMIGIKGPSWLGSPDWALRSLVLMSSWAGIGGGRMIIFLAGLQGVPQQLYEAAELDGAGVMQKFIHVTLPMLSPTILFNVIMTMIGSLGVFASAFMTTKGGPAYATWFYMLHLYENAFNNFRMGYASALAWLYFVVIIALTGIQLKFAGSWVHYEGAIPQ